MKFVRAILFIINLFLIIGLVATTLGGVVSPSRSVIPSMLAYAYLPMLAANLLMVLLWGLMRRWEALLSVAAIALRWSMVGMYFQVGGHSQVPPQNGAIDRLAVLTYNVHQFQGPDLHATSNPEYGRQFLQLVEEQGPDVLCLQEFAPVKGMNLTDSLTFMGYNHHYASSQRSNGVPLNTVVFSRLPINYVQRLDSQKVLVELSVGKERVRICCVHMDSYQFDDSDRAEIDRARHGDVKDGGLRPTLRKVKNTIVKHEKEWSNELAPVAQQSSVPMLVTGDLNDIPGSWLYHQLSAHLTDAFRAQGNGMSITYNGGFPQFRIDMAFCNAKLEPLSYHRICTKLSDHYPIITSYRIK